MEEKCRQASGCRSPCLEPGSYISGARLNEGTQDDNARPNRSTAQDADDTLAAYPAGDHHVGMLSWKQETGASYDDVDIGERLWSRRRTISSRRRRFARRSRRAWLLRRGG
jgi:hypothetical protein